MSFAETRKSKFERRIIGRLRQAAADYEMFADGEEILTAVSGKDSLTLVHLLRHFHPPLKLVPVYVDAEWDGRPSPAIAPLTEALSRFGLTLQVVRADFAPEVAAGGKRPCFICSRRRREVLVRLAHSQGISRIALGHTEDDFAETLLLNILYSREISAMHPRQPLFRGKFFLVRPLCYLNREEIAYIAAGLDLPSIPQPCPYSQHSEREKVRAFLAELSQGKPRVAHNAFLAMGRVRPDFLPIYPGYLKKKSGAK